MAMASLYFDELAALATLPTDSPIPGACVFDAHGGLNALVGIEWSVGVSIFQIEGYIPIIDEEHYLALSTRALAVFSWQR